MGKHYKYYNEPNDTDDDDENDEKNILYKNYENKIDIYSDIHQNLLRFIEEEGYSLCEFLTFEKLQKFIDS